MPQRRLNHNDIIRFSYEKLKFLIKSVYYDVLPTPANKSKWFKTEEKCLLCGKERSLAHILSGCSAALSQGRYKWRHDRVLQEIASTVQAKVVDDKDNVDTKRKQISFAKEGQKGQKQELIENYNFLSAAQDWNV